MVTNALIHIEYCLKYMCQLKDPAIFRFCAIPQEAVVDLWPLILLRVVPIILVTLFDDATGLCGAATLKGKDTKRSMEDSSSYTSFSLLGSDPNLLDIGHQLVNEVPLQRNSSHGHQMLDTFSLLRKTNQAPPHVYNSSISDLEFMDPAILAIGGRVPNGLSSPRLDMTSKFPSHHTSFKNENRLRLLMQRSLHTTKPDIYRARRSFSLSPKNRFL
ncbi:Nucleotide-binding, alpha-beta plait [Artemisia annua]|uniref:Nucleotide-binding, alpha-beta plait n=1 Tax=Artemisia annua TaxID=35608 RepID=A0A2U1P902_ARTAN|nr:Nucleotide-binding, alpha-beta plait [Artemisia annua]